MSHPVQLDARDYYLSPRWDNLIQWLSYWHQIERVLTYLSPGAQLLEIGPGNGTVSTYLRARGYHVVTLDHDPALSPAVIGDAMTLPFASESFDGVICCEVLEHLPFEDALDTLQDIHRIIRQVCVVSVPYQSLYLSICALPTYARILDPAFRLLKLRPQEPARLMLRLPMFFRSQPVTPLHHWEMGLKKFSRRKVESAFTALGFTIRSRASHLLYGYHEYYVLEKSRGASACKE